MELDQQFLWGQFEKNREEESSGGRKIGLKRPRVDLDSSNILEYVATLKPPASRPFPQRRSDRVSKFRNPYGCDRGPALDPALMGYLCPRTLSKRERDEAEEYLKTIPRLISPNDGFSAEAIAACEARWNPPPPPPPRASDEDIVKKYKAQGLDEKALESCVHFYGDDPTKLMEFVTGFIHFVEMGFSCNEVTEALIIHKRDIDKSLAYLNHMKKQATLPNPFEAHRNKHKKQEPVPNPFEPLPNPFSRLSQQSQETSHFKR